METFSKKWKLSFMRGAIAIFFFGVVTIIELIMFVDTKNLLSIIVFMVLFTLFVGTSIYAFLRLGKLRACLEKDSAVKSAEEA